MWNPFASLFSHESKKFTATVLLVTVIVSAAVGGAFGVVGGVLIAPRLAQLPSPPSFSPRAPLTDVEAVVKQNAPAVVSIVITKDVARIQPRPLPFDPFGNDFFDNFFNPPQPTPPTIEKQEVGGGTGFFVSSDGLIVTNKHVVADEQAEYTVLLNNGKKINAQVLARDSVTDLAIVKVDGKDFSTVTLGDSATLQLGQPVVAIGNALGEFRNTVSTGVISGLARSIIAGGALFGSEQLTGVIQTDAAINPGNSGGPLLNARGEVVGINTAVAQGAQNIGFAIPVNEVKQIIDSVKKTGRIVRPFLGVRYTIITPDLAKAQSLPVDYGALIVRGNTPTDLAVTPGSPADRAGLRENDIILEIGDKKITEENQLSQLIAGYHVGDSVTMKIMQRGETKTITVKLAERK